MLSPAPPVPEKYVCPNESAAAANNNTIVKNCFLHIFVSLWELLKSYPFHRNGVFRSLPLKKAISRLIDVKLQGISKNQPGF
jgi:hypothetical protein